MGWWIVGGIVAGLLLLMFVTAKANREHDERVEEMIRWSEKELHDQGAAKQ